MCGCCSVVSVSDGVLCRFVLWCRVVVMCCGVSYCVVLGDGVLRFVVW